MPMEPRLDEPGDQFPIGMRVLAVDDDPTCLRVLQTLLTRCQYQVTTTNQATTALKMLRENKFDLVISDVHMPDMDGFKLLELVGLEMDLPVIMLSANGDPKLVMKGIDHGACDYLLKPIRIEELKNIWQHVIRKKKHDPKDQSSSGNQERHQYGSGDTQFSGNADQNENINRKRKEQDDDDENDDMGHENDDPSAQKKPRVVWSVDLHRKFVLAVNQLGLDKAVPKKILDLMNVDKLSRENVASHLQKYRLYLKRISNAANQQANMVAALGNTDPNYMRVGSMNGIGSYHSLVGSGQFQNPLYNTFPSNGMLGRLNTPLSLGMRGLPSSGVVHMGHDAQNSTNGQAKFQPVVFPGTHSGNILQGMPMSLELDQLHNNNGVPIGGLSNAVDDMTIFPVSSGFPDAKVTTNPLLGAPSNPLIAGHLQESQGSRGFGTQSSISMTSLNSDLSSHIPDHGRCNSNWSNAVHSSGAQTNSFPSSDSFQHTNNLRDRVSTMTLPIGNTSPSGAFSTSSQMQYRRTDLQGQVPSNNVDARQTIGNVSAQGFDFYKQDVAYRPNYVGSSMSSVTPTNGTLGCSLSQSLDPQNTNFGASVDINLIRQAKFVKNIERDKSGLETSMQLHEGYLMGQQKLQGSFVSNNFGSLEDLATAMLRQDQVNHVRPHGDFGSSIYPSRTCP